MTSPAERHALVGAFVARPAAPWFGDADRRVVRRAMLDTLAVAVAATADPLAAVLAGCRTEADRHGAARLWSPGGRADAERAAFINGAIAHALDYDDAAPAWRGHPSAVMLPALFALRAAQEMPLDRIAGAYGVGFELAAALGAALGEAHYQRGWHATATVGVLAAAAAGANLLGFAPPVVAHALGLAAAQAAGLQANFGTTAKAAHAGFAAAAAVRALRLAAAGFEASDGALFGPGGYLALYGEGGDGQALAALGTTPPAVRRSGIEAKLYPMCYGAHRAVAAALDLAAAGVAPEAIERVEVIGSRSAHAALRPDWPDTGAAARFSGAYGVAAALIDGGVGLGSFTDAAVARPAVAALMARITLREEDGPRLPRLARVVVHLRDGSTVERRVAALPGRMDEDAVEDSLRRKAADCLRWAGHAEGADALAALVLDDPGATVGGVLDALPPWPGAEGRAGAYDV